MGPLGRMAVLYLVYLCMYRLYQARWESFASFANRGSLNPLATPSYHHCTTCPISGVGTSTSLSKRPNVTFLPTHPRQHQPPCLSKPVMRGNGECGGRHLVPCRAVAHVHIAAPRHIPSSALNARRTKEKKQKEFAPTHSGPPISPSSSHVDVYRLRRATQYYRAISRISYASISQPDTLQILQWQAYHRERIATESRLSQSRQTFKFWIITRGIT